LLNFTDDASLCLLVGVNDFGARKQNIFLVELGPNERQHDVVQMIHAHQFKLAPDPDSPHKAMRDVLGHANMGTKPIDAQKLRTSQRTLQLRVRKERERRCHTILRVVGVAPQLQHLFPMRRRISLRMPPQLERRRAKGEVHWRPEQLRRLHHVRYLGVLRAALVALRLGILSNRSVH
jgi:hypothetical protein